MNTPFNIIHSTILTNRRMAGQYHYLWTGQYDKKWNTTWCIVDQSQDVCDVLYVINTYRDWNIWNIAIFIHTSKNIYMLDNICITSGFSFWLAARCFSYVLSLRQDNTFWGLCYISCGALAGMRNSSVRPPWRIQLMTHCTMSKHSNH